MYAGFGLLLQFLFVLILINNNNNNNNIIIIIIIIIIVIIINSRGFICPSVSSTKAFTPTIDVVKKKTNLIKVQAGKKYF